MVKKDKGIRPIAVGDVFIRLIGLALLEKHSDAIKRRFDRFQFAMAFENGLETVVHSIRRLCHEDENLFVCTIDARNAFNSASRAKMAQELLTHSTFSRLRPLFKMLYGRESFLFMEARTEVELVRALILSKEGSRQGCPFGMFLFCLALQPILEKLQILNPACRFFAIADDVTIVGPQDAMKKAIIDTRTLLKEIGLDVNLSKCELFGSFDISTEIFGDNEKPVFSSSSIHLLGCLVARHCLKKQISYCPSFKNIKYLLNA